MIFLARYWKVIVPVVGILSLTIYMGVLRGQVSKITHQNLTLQDENAQLKLSLKLEKETRAKELRWAKESVESMRRTVEETTSEKERYVKMVSSLREKAKMADRIVDSPVVPLFAPVR
jgi:hypothetical protein